MSVLNCLCGERIEAEGAEALNDAYWAHTDEKHRDIPITNAQRQSATEAILRTGGWDGQRRELDDDVEIRPLVPDMRDDYLYYFDREGLADNPAWAGCYCLSYHTSHEPRDWAQRPASQNRAERSAMIERGQASGVLAYSGGKVAGWCNASPWTALPLLATYPEFVPEDPETAGGIVCFVIAPSYRGQGLAGKLLAGACEMLRDRGLTSVYAYPPKAGGGTDAGSYHGKLPMYLAAGFEETFKGNARYTVVRKAL